MARRNEDLESSYLVLKTQVTKMEKELDRLRKLTQELTSEISHFMFLDNGVNLGNFSQTEIDNLKSNSRKKITCLSRQLWHPYTSVNNEPTLGGEVPKERTVYLMDEWFMDPSDKEDEMKKACEGESSKSGGAAMGKGRTVYLMDEWRNMDP
ncbi:hypothetical protein Bca4012_046984 [Brassica carinata]|uniref:(rape) hypothetical protein n=1 Tax=Brassica napus TaxID=3708 RepID=A0A816JKS6_BRANA|nr:uncharacterized protein LOC106440634 isoform X2 [Brassica napus]CAF1790891.1 unnamed protein product [Brassica napus]